MDSFFTPDFFILGAPKCGTTALASFLATHPNVNFARFKEPHFFCTDLDWTIVKDEIAYAKLFENRKRRKNRLSQQLSGEASVFYLLSTEAVDRIEARGTQPKYIVMLRDPLQLLRSLYLENRKAGDEVHETFLEAWKASLGPASKAHRNPVAMGYKAVASLGTQVERLLNQVQSTRIHFIFHEDFFSKPSQIYSETLQFLNLPMDERRVFPIENESRDYHNIAYNRFITKTSDLIGPHSRLRSTLRLIARALRNPNIKSESDFDKCSRNDFNDIAAYFAPEVRLLGDLVGRDLSHWLKPETAGFTLVD